MKLMIEVYVCYLQITKKKSHVGATVKAVINVLLKINMIYKGTLFGAKEYFRPLGVPCIERYL